MTILDPEEGGTPSGAPVPSSPDAARALYQAVWRWHFYAGLYVVPFLCVSALTGLLMLWTSATTDLNGARTVVPVEGNWQPVSAQVAAAEAAIPGGLAAQYVEPREAGRVSLVKVVGEGEGGDAAVLLDPYTARVVDAFAWDDSIYTLASDIHGTLLLGTLGDRLIEVAAGLGIVLIVTGLYLWWPRQPGRGLILVPSRSARGRSWWLRLHASVGVWTAALLLAFLVSGLSWSGIWGERLMQAWNTFPAEKWEAPLSDATHADMNAHAEHGVPWTLEQTPLPASGSLVGTPAVTAPVTLDAVAAFASSLGFQGRFQIILPQAKAGVWTVSHDTMSNDGGLATGDRTLHLDRFTGHVLADVRYADYSPYARAMAWGVAFHEGDLGDWNLALNTLVCLAVLTLSASGLAMWWHRRPARALRLGAPPAPGHVTGWKGVAVIAAVLGLAFPLTGLVLVGVLALDLLVIQRLPALRRALS